VSNVAQPAKTYHVFVITEAFEIDRGEFAKARVKSESQIIWAQ